MVRLMSSTLSVRAIMIVSSYEFVTYPVHRQKVTRLFGDGFEFLANANNMGIHGAGGRKILVAPDLVEKPVAAQCFSGVTEKVLEQLKLLPRELDALSPAHDLVAAQIDLDVAEDITVLLLRKCVCPSQNGLDASEEFANGERLGDIVIGTQLETNDLIDFLAACGKHNDGDRGAFGL